MTTQTHTRAKQREDFLLIHGLGNARLHALPNDASRRCYFRLSSNGQHYLLMDSPPDSEDPRPFVAIAQALQAANIPVPKLHQIDLDNGLLLIEDLGQDTYTKLLAQNTTHKNNETVLSEQQLYEKAVDTLLQFQQPTLTNATQERYDLQRTLQETRLFLDWFIPYHAPAHHPLTTAQRDQFNQAITQCYNQLPPLPEILVHRDFHVDNLIIKQQQCHLIDFQDACLGSPAYDLMSLCEDARRDVDQTLQQHLYQRFLKASAYDATAFAAHYDFWACQRHLKVLGIFARLKHRDQRDQYLQHQPRVWRLLQNHLHKEPLHPLAKWFNQQLSNFSMP